MAAFKMQILFQLRNIFNSFISLLTMQVLISRDQKANTFQRQEGDQVRLEWVAATDDRKVER